MLADLKINVEKTHARFFRSEEVVWRSPADHRLAGTWTGVEL